MQPLLTLASRRLHLRQVPRCQQLTRWFHDSRILESGHSRWATIKHDKGKNDAIKHKQRNVFAQEIATTSKLFGPDPNLNPRLAGLIAKAKKTGFAKSSIEAAIARGQGRSLSGAALEQVTVEGILPPNVAVIIDCETDNKLRTLAEVRLRIKDHGGSSTPTSYLFAKKGRITFEKKEDTTLDTVFDHALEAGALDVVEDAEGRVVVYTEPNETKATGETLSQSLGLDISSSEIIWDANEDTRVPLEPGNAVNEISKFVDMLQEKETSVQGVYMNVAQGSLDEESWADIQSRITA